MVNTKISTKIYLEFYFALTSQMLLLDAFLYFSKALQSGNNGSRNVEESKHSINEDVIGTQIFENIDVTSFTNLLFIQEHLTPSVQEE